MTNRDPNPNPDERDRSMPDDGRGRRSFLRTAAAGGAGLAVGAAVGGTAGAAAADGSADSTTTLSFEVACIGSTERPFIVPWFADASPVFAALDPADIRGSLYWVEGWIYPTGTLPPEGFIPTEEDRIGTWFCRGNFVSSPDRSEPHIASLQEYHLGGFNEPGPLGQRLLTSQGIEGRDDPGWSAYRTVTGGTGEYRGARGQVLQTMIGLNSTPSGPEGLPTANFRFEFDIDLP